MESKIVSREQLERTDGAGLLKKDENEVIAEKIRQSFREARRVFR